MKEGDITAVLATLSETFPEVLNNSQNTMEKDDTNTPPPCSIEWFYPCLVSLSVEKDFFASQLGNDRLNPNLNILNTRCCFLRHRVRRLKKRV